MKELLETIVKALVDDPSAVSVTEADKGGIVILELRVAPDDMGKVIGRQGKIAQAIRSVIKAASSKDGKRYSVDILDS